MAQTREESDAAPPVHAPVPALASAPPMGRGQRLRRRALADEVRDLIAADFILTGATSVGEMLPSEMELAERYGVSRVTLRAGMRSLQQAGLIISRHGVGWLVVTDPNRLLQGLDQLSSLETFAHQAGKDLSTVQLHYEEVRADESLARTLEVGLDHPVLSISRLKTLNRTPVGWLVDFVPEGLLPFKTLEREFAGSVLDVLLGHQDLGLEYADTEIQPVNVEPEMAARLGVATGTAALYTDSIVRGAEDRVIEWAQGWLLPDHLRFRVRRRRQIG